MAYRQNVDSRLCFVLMPFEGDFTLYYEKIIKPVCIELGLCPLRADEILGPGQIIDDITSHIWRARVVIADATGPNRNVAFELGVCYALGVPTIVITKNIKDVPSILHLRRCIHYQTDQPGWDDKLHEDLKKAMLAVLARRESETKAALADGTNAPRGRRRRMMPTNGNGSKAKMNWSSNLRWKGIVRPYSPADVLRLRGSIQIEHTLARRGAERLWHLLHTKSYVPALGAITGNQAIEQVHAGLQAIYASGWQVAADGNTAGDVYPDQSLYPADSCPALVRRINRALQRADQIDCAEGKNGTYWFAPIVADAEAGFGGPLNAFEIMKAMIEAGAAAVHFEDQLSSAKKCGHLGGKVVVPTREFIEKLVAARLAADVTGVPTILIARTDANSAGLLLSDADPRDREFIKGPRTAEGFFEFRGGLDAAIARGLAYAPYADMIWCETSTPDIEEARRFAAAIHAQFPGKLLAYNCSPSFNWKKKLDDATIASFQEQLGDMGYKFQFVTLAGFHALNLSMFDLARNYRETGMSAYSRLQETEFRLEEAYGYRGVKHQRFVGTGYFDEVALTISGGMSSTTALAGSTESDQFTKPAAAAVVQPVKDQPAQAPRILQPPSRNLGPRRPAAPSAT